MTPTDKKLYELFSDKTLSEGCVLVFGDVYYTYYFSDSFDRPCLRGNGGTHHIDQEILNENILGHEPTITNIFRVAKKNGEDMFMGSESLLLSPDIRKIYVPYNPTQSLLNQSEETKLDLIKLFS